MSIETWKNEFLDENFLKEVGEKSWEKCVQHSLKKWEGLKESNLFKHNLAKENNNLFLEEKKANSENTFKQIKINAQNCSLCVKAANGTNHINCEECPIFVMRGYACDEPDPTNGEDGENRESEWMQWYSWGNTTPMTQLLEETLEFVQKGGMDE